MPLIRSFVRDLCEGDSVAAVFAVRERERRTRRSGDDFLRLVVADKTGTVEAVCWEEVDDLFELTAPGAVLFIEGQFSIHPRYGGKITVRAARIADEGEYTHEDLAEGPPVSIEELEGRLRQLLETIQNPSALQALLDRVFGADSEIWQRFRVAPAAKYYHQAYVHGLLDHTVSVAEAVSAAAGRVPRASTATSRSPERFSTTSARPRPTTTIHLRSTSPMPGGCLARSRSATT